MTRKSITAKIDGKGSGDSKMSSGAKMIRAYEDYTDKILILLFAGPTTTAAYPAAVGAVARLDSNTQVSARHAWSFFQRRYIVRPEGADA